MPHPATVPRHRPAARLAARLVALVGALLIAAVTPARTSIRMAVIDANYRAAFDAVAREYMRLKPDVNVQVQIVPASGYATWIRTAVAGGADTAPDIYSFNYGAGFYESGKAVNLLPYLESPSPYTGKRWRDSFHPEYLEMLQLGNDMPQVPLNYIEIGIFYNKAIFERVGIVPPTTWEQLMEACERIRAAGYIPVSMPAEKDDYWGGVVGWVVRLFTDAWYYDKVPVVMARPGDFLFRPEANTNFVVNYDDPFADLLVVLSSERRLQAILDGDLDFDGPRMRELYIYLKDFSRHWQYGFHGTNSMAAYNLFLNQRAAMMFNASPAVLLIDRDMGRLPADSRFEWGAFHPPRVTSSEFVRTPFRGVGAPLPVYGILKKDQRQVDAAADFLMFLTSPPIARLILEETIKAEEAIVGPFSIKDVPLDPEMDARFRPFLGHGREKLESRGLEDEQESVWRWSTLAQDYIADRITIDEFLERYQRLIVQTIPRLIRRYELDMDPRTRDNNTPLLREVEGAIVEARAAATTFPDAGAFLDHLATRSLEQARRVRRSEAGAPFPLVIESTVPVVVVDNPRDYQLMLDRAREKAAAAGAQYLLVVRLDNGRPAEHRTFSFRPSPDEVIAALEGRRYTREQLRQIFR